MTDAKRSNERNLAYETPDIIGSIYFAHINTIKNQMRINKKEDYVTPTLQKIPSISSAYTEISITGFSAISLFFVRLKATDVERSL